MINRRSINWAGILNSKFMTEQSKNWLIGLIILIIVAVGLWVYKANKNESSQVPLNQESGTGRLVVAVTDAAASLQNIKAVNLTVDQIEVQGTSQGWVTVTETDQTVDLISLKNSNSWELLAQAEIEAGIYNQIRLDVSKVVVVMTDGTQVTAQLPSGELKLVGKLVVESGQTSTIAIDFLLDKSLHITGNGKVILTPVVKLEIKSNANVEVDSANTVTIKSGRIEESSTQGMDIDGTVKNNFEVTSDLDLIGNTIHASTKSQSEGGLKISAAKATDLAKASAQIDTVISVQLITQNNKKVWQVGGLLNLIPKIVYVDATSGVIVNSSAGQ